MRLQATTPFATADAQLIGTRLIGSLNKSAKSKPSQLVFDELLVATEPGPDQIVSYNVHEYSVANHAAAIIARSN